MRISFTKRSYEKELLDRGDIPFADIEQNMRELDFINTWLGGHGISVKGLKKLLGGRRRIRICEIGCGGGDNLRVLSGYCRRRGVDVEVIGIDSNEHCIAVAREKWRDGNADWMNLDYRHLISRLLRLPKVPQAITEEKVPPLVRMVNDDRSNVISVTFTDSRRSTPSARAIPAKAASIL